MYRIVIVAFMNDWFFCRVIWNPVLSSLRTGCSIMNKQRLAVSIRALKLMAMHRSSEGYRTEFALGTLPALVEFCLCPVDVACPINIISRDWLPRHRFILLPKSGSASCCTLAFPFSALEDGTMAGIFRHV
jgi:hypothetical protein